MGTLASGWISISRTSATFSAVFSSLILIGADSLFSISSADLTMISF